MKRPAIALITVSIILAICAGGTASAGHVLPDAGSTCPPGASYVPGEILVEWKQGLTEDGIKAAGSRLGLGAREPLASTDNTELVEVSGGRIKEVIESLHRSGLVEKAVPNFIRRADFTPDDPLFGDQWNLKEKADGGGIDMEAAWETQKGDVSVVVAILDTGVAYQDRGIYKRAPDLAETGFVQGYDFINGDPYADDDNWHGTHVCGTVAQSTDNTLGVAGVAFRCSIMPVKVLDQEGVGSDAAIIQGIRYAADNGADVINMSLSGEDESEILKEAVDYAASKGVIVCASSGNNGRDAVAYPAGYRSCIAVGATDRQSRRAGYSNYGDALDVVAPGGNAAEGILQQTYRYRGQPTGPFDYVESDGTSMASPHAAGVCALIKSKNPNWGAADVRGALASTCVDLGAAGWDPQYGFGLIDAAGALAASRLSSPDIESLSVNHAATGEILGDVEVTGTGLSAPLKVCLERENEPNVNATSVITSGGTSITCEIDLADAVPGLYNMVVENPAGSFDILEGGFMVDTADARTWFLAEGSTGYGFEEFILIQNPGSEGASAQITFMTPGGAENPYPVGVPPESRVTVRVNDIVPDTDVSARIDSDRDIICERSMYWDDRIEGTDSIGVQSGSHTWYLAEGTTDYGFDTFLLVQNPSSGPARVEVTYHTPGGPIEKEPITVGGNSRYSINVEEDLPASDVSFQVVSDRRIIAERSMYWDGRRGGHASIGTTGPAAEWYLAEGSTNWGYDEYVLIQNPGDEAVDVELTYMTPEGPIPRPALTVPAGSRMTVPVNEDLPASDVSVKASASGGIIVERAMYWDNGTGKSGHDAIGVPQARENCYLAEGSTDWGFAEWVLLQNPNDTAADVGVEYMTSAGLESRERISIPPSSRITIDVNADVPGIDTSTYVFSNLPIIAERSMYWNRRGGGHVSQGLMR